MAVRSTRDRQLATSRVERTQLKDPPAAGRSLPITLTQHLADMLWLTGTTSPRILREQRDRFESDPALPDPDDPIFAQSSMRWCRTAADAVLLLAYEQAAGHTATMLWDLDQDERVVLSTRVDE
ncbi:hypothetical protein GCM10017714_18970 [Curtobacterium pusillum]|nr:hypothetical protein GCM10017610_33380 [Curtobacterium pusillum]